MNLPRAAGEPALRGVLRARPEDFRVDEVLPFAPAGAGEHVLIRLEKTAANTNWVAGQLARCAGVRRRDVGFAGRKDRHAVARQWFSVWLPGKATPDTAHWSIDGVSIIETHRHPRKLRTGSLAGNAFAITVRELNGDQQDLLQRVAGLRQRGAPNYFGAQRFGRDRRNLELAQQLFGKRQRLRRDQRSMALSAARAEIFNAVLAARVSDSSWIEARAGDCLNLDGSRSFFLSEAPDAEISARIASGDLHLTGPLWGEGELPTAAGVSELEQTIAGRYALFAKGLAAARLRQERRALRVMPRKLQAELSGSALRVSFTLPAGAFATSVIAELVATRDAVTDAIAAPAGRSARTPA